ncbi:hypothetical protein TPHA_0F02890 [Tetrapisispora phaffii CBS 4417]|uniref:Uncharacterized protein n=1 Tax=Tetrapisispora phaffii (strain ATCC 24235 / CBS 4417 / NBRC 1672 / NRRL Y-8282 / UCD 70-5) TaxID=1071381 RepID=G8BUI4_TETPH|nr:hypothetical protein TPHA_0F02890 [Tetrapisispora phaffii CBS 4417]CCE63770.1 hypothetical protein TPHA_0F02890 [Tetrapisispora phaffii CBS 4417]
MVSIANPHSDLIHDTALDYYGKRLATCSSDKTIKIFDIEGGNQRLVDTLFGHEGPVWRVEWAHPKFGNTLASCSYDGKVLIWKEENGKWSQIAVHSTHTASVNSVKWAPHEYGALLLAGSSDGKVSIIEFEENGSLTPIVIDAHSIGVNSVCWAPAVVEEQNKSLKQLRRFVTGGADNLVKVWKYESNSKTYSLEESLEGHSDWVRDVAWSPSLLSQSYIASVSQDRTCVIWTQVNNDGPWKKTLLKSEKFSDVLWRASWSLSGNVLAISGGDNKVTLWKQNLSGSWDSAGEVQQ